MSIPTNVAKAAAIKLRDQGFFTRAGEGDERAASYFARLVAYTVNPDGDPEGFGVLRKTGGGFNVDGYADGAIVYGSDPQDFENVIKIVTQIGTTHAGIGDAIQDRRPVDVWEAPKPLTLEQMRYLKPSYAPDGDTPPTPPIVPPTPQPNNELIALLARMAASIENIEQRISTLDGDLDGISTQVEDVRNALRNGLGISIEAQSNKVPYLGAVTLKGSGVAKG